MPCLPGSEITSTQSSVVAWCVKDPALSLMWLALRLWPGNFCRLWLWLWLWQRERKEGWASAQLEAWSTQAEDRVLSPWR